MLEMASISRVPCLYFDCGPNFEITVFASCFGVFKGSMLLWSYFSWQYVFLIVNDAFCFLSMAARRLGKLWLRKTTKQGVNFFSEMRVFPFFLSIYVLWNFRNLLLCSFFGAGFKMEHPFSINVHSLNFLFVCN